MRLETGSENLSFPNRAQCLLIKTHQFLLSRLKKNGVSEEKREQKIGTATPDRTEIQGKNSINTRHRVVMIEQKYSSVIVIYAFQMQLRILQFSTIYLKNRMIRKLQVVSPISYSCVITILHAIRQSRRKSCLCHQKHFKGKY